MKIQGKEKTYTIAVLYICTGKYVAFWKKFYESFEENFLKNSQVEYFVFTDAENLYQQQENPRIHKIYQSNLGWPGNTLFRFRMFNTLKENLEQFDYTFFFNANTICAKTITEQEFLPEKEELLVVQHPGFYNTNIMKLPYERRRKSSAYIPYGKGKTYVYGAVNGGKTKSYLAMCEQLEKEIDEDYQRGVIARWHDESHLNHYIWKHKNYRLLSPAYAYPENYNLPFEAYIKTIDKKTVIELDQAKLNELENKSIRKRIQKRFCKTKRHSQG